MSSLREYFNYNMLKIVATRATRMPVSPVAWSSSSLTDFGGGGGGGEDDGDGKGGGGGGGGGGLGFVLHAAAVSVPKEHLLEPVA